MKPNRDANWQAIDALLDRLFDLSPEARESILREMASEDTELARTARRLLAAADSFDLRPGGALATGLLRGFAADVPAPDSAVGERIGPWLLVGELGAGGMGRVYRAERADGQFERQVALKLLFAGTRSDDLERRFEQERRILARLDHPHIARLLDGGVTDDGRPWFAMELVDGIRIDHYCDRHRLSVEERLRLFSTVAEAVQAAHRNLVIHRDLKPANVLVAGDGEVKLLDFGIAKPLDSEEQTADATRTLQRMLTPSYATPEQIRGETLTTASDVYQLGLLLYELLTGRRAQRLEETTPQAIERAVCETPPTRPSLAVLESAAPDGDGTEAETLAAARSMTPTRLARRLHGDLDTILLTALRKEPERRYASAEHMAEDVRRHIGALPLRARPDTVAYRVSRFVHRHAVGVASAAAAVALGGALTATYTVRLEHQRDLAEEAAARASAELARAESLHDFVLDLFDAAGPNRPRDQLPTTEEILDLGAQRALDSEAALPSERVGMLLTIGRVYLHRYRLQQARPLIEAAVDLAREHQSERPNDLARALTSSAALAWYGGGTLRQADAALLEAEALVEGRDAFWETFATARSDRAWVASLRDDQQQALALLEPLYQQMQQRDGVSLSTRYQTVNRLANTYHRLGDLEAAVKRHAEATELARRAFGTKSLSYAVHLANSANVEQELGRYAESDARNLHALALYDRIFGETPHVYRAVARRNRVRTLLAMGKFDRAWSRLDRSTDEFSRAVGVPPQEDASRFFHQGEMRIQIHAWERAAASLRRARDLYNASADTEIDSLIKTDSMLAWAQCRRGRVAEAANLLEGLTAYPTSALPNDNRSRARLLTSRACVAFRKGRHETALTSITGALEAVTHPGRVVDRADRLVLRARVLAEIGRRPEAARDLNNAQNLYRRLALTRHPLYSEIDAVRRQLFPGN